MYFIVCVFCVFDFFMSVFKVVLSSVSFSLCWDIVCVVVVDGVV